MDERYFGCLLDSSFLLRCLLLLWQDVDEFFGGQRSFVTESAVRLKEANVALERMLRSQCGKHPETLSATYLMEWATHAL
jgi:hypothetical protein